MARMGNADVKAELIGQFWHYADGTVIPRMAGGETQTGSTGTQSGTGGGEGSGEGQGSGSSSGEGDGGKKEGDEGQEDPVAKAYAKLREAEANNRKLQADLTKAQRKDLQEVDRLKAELDDAQNAAAGLQEALDEINREKAVTAVASKLKFRNPSLAARLVSKDAEDDKAIEKELKDILKDTPELAAKGTPPPPVDEGNGGSGGSGSSRMNEMIRSAAGRGPQQ